MTRVRALIIVGALASLALPASSATAGKQFAAQQAAGIGIVRQTLPWAQIEIAPNNYDFTPFDGFVAAAARHNIRVLPVLFDPPPFRSSRPKGKTKYTYFPKSNADMAEF